MRPMLTVIIALGLTVVSAGTGADAYEENAAVGGVAVSGRIAFTGAIPKPERVPVHRDSKFCGDTIAIERLQVDQARGLEGVVISLESINKGKPAVPENAVITFENRTCRFVPRVKAAVVGSMLEIRNSDPILHNTHIRLDDRSGPTVINVVQPAGSNVIHKPLRVAGLLDIRCDAHAFMHASIHVFEHPYFAVTDSAGRYELTQVPPGTYRFRMWHETLGVRTKTISVPSTGALTLDLELGPEE
jgi:hypothetical protein